MGVIVGIEGGGTKTGCAVLDEQGTLLAYAEGGPANLNFVDEATQRHSFETAVEGALAGIRAPVIAVGYTVAGTRANWAWVLQRLGDPPAYPVEEARMAMLSTGVEEAHGVAIIAGTGSLVAGFRHDALVMQMGGWGALLGDEGSAYDVAIRALRSAVRAWDGREPETQLIAAVQRYFGVNDLRELVPLFYQQGVPRHQIAAFAKSVADTAHQGDTAAIRVLVQASTELAGDAITCARKLFQQDEKFTVALTGGMFHSPIYGAAFKEMFALQFPQAELRQAVMAPAVAVARAVWKRLARPTP